MYRYKFSSDHSAVYVQHYGEFVRDEGDRAMLEIFTRCSAATLSKLEAFIADYRKVSSVTLFDSDRARLRVFWTRVEKILQEKQATCLKETLERWVVLPDEESVRQDFKERLRRISAAYVESSPINKMIILTPEGLAARMEGNGWFDCPESRRWLEEV